MTVATEDHEAVFLSRLTGAFKDKTSFQALARIVGKYANELETVFADILLKYVLDNATGDQLRIIGKIVGQTQGSEDDATFRLYVKARIKVNRSSGQIDELITIAKLVTGLSTSKLVEYLPNEMDLRMLSGAVSQSANDVLLQMMDDAKMDVVRLFVTTAEVAPASQFTFDTGPGFDTGHLASCEES